MSSGDDLGDDLATRIHGLEESQPRDGDEALLPIDNEISSLKKIHSCTKRLSDYHISSLTILVNNRVRQLNAIGSGILSGVLRDMGTIHESRRVHGDINMRSIRIWELGSRDCLGSLPDHGRLNSLAEGPELSNGISQDFRALAIVINEMFRKTDGLDNIPLEVVHLLKLLQTETHSRQRGLIYFHPCTLENGRKWGIVSGILAMIEKDTETERAVSNALWGMDLTILSKWTKETKSRSLGDQYNTTYSRLEWDITSFMQSKNTTSAYPFQFFLEYIKRVMGHRETRTLEYKLKHLYELYPTLLCHLLQLTLHIKKIKLEVYEGYLCDLVRGDKQRGNEDML